MGAIKPEQAFLCINIVFVRPVLRSDCHLLKQVLVATSTLAWGVNFPAHLVVVKGTEYYDGKSRRYVDYPITGTVHHCPSCVMDK